jgi:hypothetical protein
MRRLNALVFAASCFFASLVSAEAFAGGGGGWLPFCPLRPALTYVSNVEHGRADLGAWYINGQFSRAPNVFGRYGGGGGGLQLQCGMLIRKWFMFDATYRFAGGGWGNGNRAVDFGVDLGMGFAGAKWFGKLPGSFVFGIGGGASIGRPIWFNISASVYPQAHGRLMLKFSQNVRMTMEYKYSPISTQLKFYDAWVMAHDASFTLGYAWYHFGARGRMEDIYLDRAPQRNLRSYWIGGFLGFTYY